MDIERKIRLEAEYAVRLHETFLTKHSKQEKKAVSEQLRLPPNSCLLLGYEELKCSCNVCKYISYYYNKQKISSDLPIGVLAILAVIEAISKNKSLQNIEYYNRLINKMLKH